MAKDVSASRVGSKALGLVALGIGLFLAPSQALADGSRGGRSTTDEQAEAKKEEAGVRVLGTSGLEDVNDPTLRAVTPERRSGFTAGLSIGASLGAASGYPNDPTKLGLDAYHTDTGVGAGYGGRVWVGFALRDFLTFGLMFGSTGFSGNEKVFFGGVLGFHTEIFPAYALGGPFRDLGISLETGAGVAVAMPSADTNTILIDGGLTSCFGGSVFYEGLHLGPKLGMGPFLSYDHWYAPSMSGGAFVLGWRTAIYPMQKK